jgi:hypothetical protein
MKNFTEVNGYLFGAIGVISCFVVGLIVSILTQDKKP